MSEIFKQLSLQFILILLNAFFAATEIAVISLNEKKVKAKAEDGDKKAEKMLRMIEEPTRFLSTIQIGITLAGFLGSAFAADNFAERLSVFMVNTFNIPEMYLGVIDDVSVIAITLILSFFTLVLGELVPKRIAMKHKEKFAEVVCNTISTLAVLLKPIIWLLTVSTNGVLRLFGIDPNEKDEPVSEEDIVIMLDAGADEGSLNQDDIEYIKNVFKLDRLTAADIMTPRKQISFIDEDATEEEILKTIEENGYSRIPVYSDTVDEIVGVLYSRDYLLKHKKPGFELKQAMFEPTFVPETMHLDLLFKEMQTEHNHIVIVVSEYGIPSGIVTMEDILEELVGEIWDESDEAVENISKIDDNIYRVLCTTSTEDFFEFFELEPDEESEATTVNGWLIEKSENIPQDGYAFEYKNLSVTVVRADELMTHEITVQVNENITDED
ncbi:MAG: HlyC/CorC family transporter [Clostridia bacterium]|nr:HlyC/CorC family transporter [Clostridia bacterium]